MTTIIWNTPQEIEVVDAIRDAISRETIWYVVASSIACPNPLCSYDPVNQSSTNSFCVTCSGDYWIPVYSGVTISGHITWGGVDQLGWQTGGQMYEGDCRVQIKYTLANLNIVDNAKWVIVDGKNMQVNRKMLRGVKTINRILVDLQER